MFNVLKILVQKSCLDNPFFVKSPDNQGKVYIFVWTQGKSTWKHKQFRENSGKSKIQNYYEPWFMVIVYLKMQQWCEAKCFCK